MRDHGVVAAPDSVRIGVCVASATLPSNGVKTNRVARNHSCHAAGGLAVATVTHLKTGKIESDSWPCRRSVTESSGLVGYRNSKNSMFTQNQQDASPREM